MYTVTLTVPQSIIFDAERHAELESALNDLAPYIQSGQAHYVTYSEAVHIWESRFGAVPNIYYRDLPAVETAAVSSIATCSASSGGTVISEGSEAVTACGVCWSESENPTIAHNHTTDGSGSDSFTSSITGLDPGTVYHVRAYATNNYGTAYGNEVSFTTAAADLPVADIKANNADGPVTVSAGTPVLITVSLDPCASAGRNADWWIGLYTSFSSPFNVFSCVYPTEWLPGHHVFVQTGLIELLPYKVLHASLPPGQYVFWFGVDAPDDAAAGPWWGADWVEVTVQ
jgi:hypothetical protein